MPTHDLRGFGGSVAIHTGGLRRKLLDAVKMDWSQALPASRIRWLSPISSLVLTLGCRFACPYCPIPAYNQRQYRAKSGERIAEEMRRLRQEYGLRFLWNYSYGCVGAK